MKQAFTTVMFLCLLVGIAVAQQPPQPKPGTAAQIGEQIDRGLNKIGTELSQGWAEVRKSLEKVGVQGRVYARLSWDKALQGATLDVDIRDDQVVVLKGTVPTASAKQKAVQLARDTVGVNSVVDELAVAGATPR